jgi:hypothetical protein
MNIMKEPNRKDNERRLAKLEQDLVAAANGPKIIVSVSDLRNKRLIEVLREKIRKRGKTTK